MSEEVVNNDNNEVAFDDIDIGQEDTEVDTEHTEEEEVDESESNDEDKDDDADASSSDNSEDVTSVKLTQEEYNQLMMNKRLLEKMSKKEEAPAPKEQPTDALSVLKAKYPDMDETSIKTLVDVVSEIAGTQFKSVVDQTTEQRIKSDISEYASANGLDAKAQSILTSVAVKPEVKKLLVDNIIDIEQLELLAYGKQYKEELAKLKVSKENGDRKKNVHSETKANGQAKKTSSVKSYKDMSWEEFDEQAKKLGISYD